MFKRLQEDIQSVFDRDPAARSTLEVLTAYPGLHAILLHRINHWLWKQGLKWIARVLSHFSRWVTGIEIHPGAQIGERFFIDHGMGVVIGETTIIGNDCTLYHGVTLGGTSWSPGKRHPTLGNDVVVGAGAKILGPIEIGDDVRIGSNAVVLKPVPAGATVVGIPGRVVSSSPDAVNERRQAMAKKMGFDAYGTTKDMPDPVANAINKMLDHLHDVDDRMKQISEALKESDGVEVPPIEPVDLESLEGEAVEDEKDSKSEK
ncbi:MAG: serine O-acetyltransferase [Gammaproteobacteria bacterium]|nr:MAG: serine O-acetyltransferase [Gammaproteobacteria bacterium]